MYITYLLALPLQQLVLCTIDPRYLPTAALETETIESVSSSNGLVKQFEQLFSTVKPV